MKTSKPALKTSVQEECGVWLDTAQLKGKAKQKRVARPISKLLNPFAGGGGYSLAVALNFTQTKVEMPKTKQSSISTFFTAQRRVLNKMCTSEEPNMDPGLLRSSSVPSTCALTASTPVASGRKRRREPDLTLYNTEPGVYPVCKSENVTEVAVWQEEAANHTPSQDKYCEFEDEQLEEIKPPYSKRRLTATCSLLDDSQPPQAWSQDPLFTYSQYSESEFYLTSQKNITAKNLNDSESSFFNSLQSKDAFGIRMNVEATTSTQKSIKHVHSSDMDEEKENSRFLSSGSPSKRMTLSTVEPLSKNKWTEPKTASPQKHIPVHLWKSANKDGNPDSQFRWKKTRSSPLKKVAPQQPCAPVDEDSMAMLFTQDSEGFRVIAHRGLQARSPLKDQSNNRTGTVRTNAYKSLVDEDEDEEMLFTQDSQGNLVIRH